MKTTIALLASVAISMSLLGQEVPSDKQPSSKHIDQRIRVSERVLDDMALKRVLPKPPWSNEKGHETGEVTVAVLVDYDGKVKSTRVTAGDPVLGDVAGNAVKQWLFKPFILNGEPVQMDSQVVMKFSKKRAEVVIGAR